jgi:hypothetical protein
MLRVTTLSAPHRCILLHYHHVNVRRQLASIGLLEFGFHHLTTLVLNLGAHDAPSHLRGQDATAHFMEWKGRHGWK